MKIFFYIMLFCILSHGSLDAQVLITGTVLDRDGQSLPGANVSIKGSYDGASADTAGCFRFKTTAIGKQILIVSYVGYKTVEMEMDLSLPPAPVQITLDWQPGEIKSVVVTAGAFETGDLKRPIVLKPMDIATTPSALGDIYGALTTLPGTQVVGEEGGLYVRGGEGYETRTYIDGMQVHKPFLSKMPDIPTRSRFSPILFRGTVFSTGGYTAEYGQALSSVVNLNTVGLVDQTETSVMLMSVGMTGSHSQRWDKGSFSGSLQYLNMMPYNSIFKQNMSWEKDPVQTDGTLLLRQQHGKYGILKVFGSFSLSKSALHYSFYGDTTGASLIGLRNNNYYINAVYSDALANQWKIKTGFSGTYDYSGTGIDKDRLEETVRGIHHRMTFTKDWGDFITLKIGEEAAWYSYERDYFTADQEQGYSTDLKEGDFAVYAEPEISLNDNMVLRTGLRAEYASRQESASLMPRLSLAYRVGDYSQVSMAYGLFRQRPESQFLINNKSLETEKATHFILNYQYEIENRIFRVELYRKWYDNLVKFTSEYNPDPSTYSNDGKGYAQGIDIFWRDSKTIRDLDYWISYSFIDSKRNYKNFSRQLQPSFLSTHTFSAVMKYFYRKANTYAGLTYVYASPKTGYNPFFEVSSGDQTKAYNDLSVNVVIIRAFLKKYCAILLNVNNLLGFNNEYGFNYSSIPDAAGNYTPYPIKPQSKRFFMAGAIFNL